ncbi:MAG: histidine--tRNA ligase [Nanobdellota archaeon]
MVFKKIKGTTDFYPREQLIQDKIYKIFEKKATHYNFTHVEPPAIESMDLLTAKSGEEIKNQIFPIEKKSKEYMGLRFEFTASIARMFIAKQKSVQKPVKWFSFNKAWRYERPQSGREREFFQFNVELLGSNSPLADAEVINLAIDSLTSLGASKADFNVKINNRKLLQGLLSEFIKDENISQVIRIIDKKDKISSERFEQELNEIGITKESIKKIKDILNINWDDLKNIDMKKTAKEGYEELKQVKELCYSDFLKFDISVARGLDYYTGTIFEIFDSDEKFRSLCGGGRYDSMIEKFGGEQCPATGFGMGYSTVKLFLEKKGLLPENEKKIDYFIAIIDQSCKQEAFKICSQLRKKNTVAIDLMDRSLAKQMKYADQINSKKVIFVGEQETQSNKIKIKDMESGEETYKKLNEL